MHLRRAAAMFACVLALCACVPTVISTEHDYVLLLETDGRLQVLADDDPLYAQFDREVMGAAYVSDLMTVYAHSMETFIATNVQTRYAQTVANKPIVVLNSNQPGVVRDVDAWSDEMRVPVELALGTGPLDMADISSAALAMPSTIGEALLTLMDVTPPENTDSIADDAIGATDQAFWQGFGAALDATYARQEPSALGRALALPDGEHLWDRYDRVPRNAMRQHPAAIEPNPSSVEIADELGTPGVVGAFFYRLINETSTYYPQRYMLWFANYDADETSYGKVMLAMSQLDDDAPSVLGFVAVYVETFPAERDEVLRLVDEVFGAGASALVAE